ncbi:extracellular solute-binding protein (plasmid) [Arthrobacter sp. zg-Y820]|uniref:ABC transporter substrate-binding protein n=1 Tax=unclassified Arthrobacter TaxID=235627 RepID=UPI001E386B2B|nr:MULTISPECIES: extracellular solute-binding protein [unclassified Arthrobacter]MCC9198496.1 extracellular solute-binding protein [Arthrobacter sp. zg-Y820]MDK1281366.1 extracellular solute-binding protein [Arthrobacter sp. zg.Y820]WIB11241.1 extracellular solute-binding protein [Arthrobacter sp. zg-Y820]
MTSTLRRIVSLMATAAVGATALTSCAGSNAGPTIAAGDVLLEGEELIAAATDGELSFYCAAAPAACEAIAEGFEAEYGVSVNVLRSTSPDLSSRYASEKQSRASTADVLLHSDIQFIAAGLEEGLITSFEEAGYLSDEFPAEWVANSSGISGTPFISEGIGIAINTDLVSEQDRPKDWMDLAAPKWKSKMTGPAAVVSGYPPLLGTLSDHVDGLIEGLRPQEIVENDGGMVSLTEALGAGQHQIQVLASPVVVGAAQEKGAPLDFIWPKSGVTGPAFAYTLNPEPANANAQKLFAQYVTSPEASEVLASISDGYAAAYLDLKFDYFPPNFEYYMKDGMQSVIDAMGGE